MTTSHPSIARLVERLDAAASETDAKVVAEGVKRVLIDEIGAGALVLPDSYAAPASNAYARRLLHKGENYAVVIMVWAPGQGTPIHDHDGLWCVECVYAGRILVRSFDLDGTPDDDVVAFREAEVIEAGRGMAGSLIPPFDYHTIENAGDVPAVTVHVYGGEMHGCHAYAKLEDGRWRRERKALSYTDD